MKYYTATIQFSAEHEPLDDFDDFMQSVRDGTIEVTDFNIGEFVEDNRMSLSETDGDRKWTVVYSYAEMIKQLAEELRKLSESETNRKDQKATKTS